MEFNFEPTLSYIADCHPKVDVDVVRNVFGKHLTGYHGTPKEKSLISELIDQIIEDLCKEFDVVRPVPDEKGVFKVDRDNDDPVENLLKGMTFNFLQVRLEYYSEFSSAVAVRRSSDDY